MYSFLMLSICVTPNEKSWHIHLCAPPVISSECIRFQPVQHCWSDRLTATLNHLYNFPFTLAGTRLSQITPDILYIWYEHIVNEGIVNRQYGNILQLAFVNNSHVHHLHLNFASWVFHTKLMIQVRSYLNNVNTVVAKLMITGFNLTLANRFC